MITNGRLAILVPSRGRPQSFLRLMESFLKTTTGCADLILRNGDADPRYHEYSSFEGFPHVIRVVGPDTGFKSSWRGTAGYNPAQQDLWKRFPGYAAYLCIEDDCVFHTQDWDRWVLSSFDVFPGRVGVTELYDRSQTIHCLAMSAEWCGALGYLCHPDLAENAFEQTVVLANMSPKQIQGARGKAEFTHLPHVRAYGYTGNERIGAVEVGNEAVVAAYRQDEADMFNNWMPTFGAAEKAKLCVAAGL